jgi:hypothetical protein
VVVQYAAADAEHQAAVPFDQGGEGRLLAPRREAFEQVVVGTVRGRAHADQRAQALHQAEQWSHRHALALPPWPPSCGPVFIFSNRRRSLAIYHEAANGAGECHFLATPAVCRERG